MSQFIGLLALGIGSGVSLVIQQVLIASLRSSLGSPLQAILVSYVGGTLAVVAVLLASRETWLAPDAFLGSFGLHWAAGVFGVVYIVIVIFLIPKLGAATVVAIVVAGQMIGSVIFDHFGLFGLQQQPADMKRVAGAAMLLGGVLLVRA